MFCGSYPYRASRNSSNLPKNVVERLALSTNFFTSSASEETSLAQGLEGHFKNALSRTRLMVFSKNF
jgi:hypothetical protein